MNDHQIVRLLSGAQSGCHLSASLILGTYVPFEVGTPTPLVRHCVRNYHRVWRLDLTCYLCFLPPFLGAHTTSERLLLPVNQTMLKLKVGWPRPPSP